MLAVQSKMWPSILWLSLASRPPETQLWQRRLMIDAIEKSRREKPRYDLGTLGTKYGIMDGKDQIVEESSE